MNSASRAKHNWRALLRPYQKALRRFLQLGPVSGLEPALRVGHQAVARGLETLDMALIHEQALIALVLSTNDAANRDRIVKWARTFFAEAILPLEETHRSALEANAHLSRLNEELGRRAMNLTASSQLLRKQIVRRQVVENALRQSQRHTSRLLEESRRLQEQLRLLSRRVLAVQEEERKRISRELHDVIAQMLTGINVRLTTLKRDASIGSKDLSKKMRILIHFGHSFRFKSATCSD